MGFFRGSKIRLFSNVQLMLANLKPATPATAQRFRFFDFLQAQNVTIKFPRLGFAVLRRRQLNVVYSQFQFQFLIVSIP